MTDMATVLASLIDRLRVRVELHPDAEQATLALPWTFRNVDAGCYVVHEGETPTHCLVLLKGMAYRHKILGDGGRQVLGIHLPGEPIDLHFSMLYPATDNVQALTPVRIAMVPRDLLLDLMRREPSLADAIWADTMAGISVFREWIANIGRRDARTRVAHILCELAVRQRLDVDAGSGSYPLPLTQTHLADALGLTSVHINRMLQSLRSEGLIRLGGQQLEILDWPALARVGDFDGAYLQMRATVPDR